MQIFSIAEETPLVIHRLLHCDKMEARWNASYIPEATDLKATKNKENKENKNKNKESYLPSWKTEKYYSRHLCPLSYSSHEYIRPCIWLLDKSKCFDIKGLIKKNSCSIQRKHLMFFTVPTPYRAAFIVANSAQASSVKQIFIHERDSASQAENNRKGRKSRF